MYLQSIHWYALSFYLTPKQIGKLLTYSSNQSQSDFKRVQTQVIQNMFKNISMKPIGISTQTMFESLTIQGYLPIPNKYAKFGYICNNRWVEWDIPSIEDTRRYWDKMLLNIKTDQRDSIVQELQALIYHLPNDKTQCDKCLWFISENSMYDDQKCIYCDDDLNRKMIIT